MSDEADGAEAAGERSWWWRLWVLLPVVAAVITFVVTLNRDGSSAGGAEPPLDIDAVPTEMLSQLVTTYRDDPEFTDQLPGVRLVLAERHFTDGAYDLAFEQYAAIVEDPAARPPQFAVSLARIAWIGWLSNRDTPRALATIDESLRVDPTNAETIYIKGQLLWCGAGDAAAASDLFRTVLRADDLTEDVRAQVTGDLDVASTGAGCG